jgi:hypothetical protein
MNKLMQEDIATKIKQTEDKMDVDAQQVDAPVEVAEMNEEERRQKSIDEVNARLDLTIEHEHEHKKEIQKVEDEDMDDDGIDHTDPMNSLAGPKEHVFDGSANDDFLVDYNLRGDAIGGNKTKLYDLTFKPRDEKDILSEIDQNIKDYIQQGEWVYSLYSVLIHSGGVGGGHYSAYIKSFEDKKWYHFNDSKVSEIPIGNIEEMYGDGHSTRNAYLVIYKKYTLKESKDAS